MDIKNNQAETTARQTNFLLIMLYQIIFFLCILACFPPEKFRLINNRLDKANILVRGMATLISPLACFLALWAYGGVVFGDAAFVMLLPIAALMVDWLNAGTAYSEERPMVSLRVSLCVVSAVVSLYASVLSEAPNLAKSMADFERKHAAQNDSEILFLDQRIAGLQTTLSNNESLLDGRMALVQKMIDNDNNAYQEANREKGGLNPDTGEVILGGKICGDNCKTYTANARAAQEKIKALDELSKKNVLIRKEIDEAQKQRQTKLENHLSDTNKIGALIEAALYHADFGVKTQITGRFFVLMFLELFSLILSHAKASQNLRDLVVNVSTEDAERLRGDHKVEMAKIMAEQAKVRSKLSAEFSPIVVQLPQKAVAMEIGENQTKSSQAANDEIIEDTKDVI